EAVHDDPSASIEGLLGTAYYLCERYDDAALHLRRAVEADPVNAEWKAKLAIAVANASTHVAEDYPPVLPFDAAELLAAPRIEPGTIPASSHGPVVETPRQRALKAAGRVTGMAAAAVMGAATRVAGLLGDSDEVWTNWYRKPLALAVATLGYMRERLDTRNLLDPYPKGDLTAFQSRGLVAPPGVLYSRTPDGSWNNLSNPKEGAAGVRFPRNVAHSAGWPESGPRLMTPNPLEISRTLLTRGPEGIKTVPFLNMLAAAWIQFMVHDWVSHRTNRTGGMHEVPVPADHPARRQYHQTKMFVPKTMADPTRSVHDEGLPPTFINEVTSWWDASQIYGSDHATALSLRSMVDGKLKLDTRGFLPVGKGDIEH